MLSSALTKEKKSIVPYYLFLQEIYHHTRHSEKKFYSKND